MIYKRFEETITEEEKTRYNNDEWSCEEFNNHILFDDSWWLHNKNGIELTLLGRYLILK